MANPETEHDEPWVVGPLGERLTRAMLPKPGTGRWVIRRKAELVAAVEGKLISKADLLRTYRVTPEEYEVWKDAVRKYGMRGLRSTRAQDYRAMEERVPGLRRAVPKLV